MLRFRFQKTFGIQCSDMRQAGWRPYGLLLLGVALALSSQPKHDVVPTLAVPPPSPYATKGVSFEDITAASGLARFRHVAGSLSKPYLPDTTGSGVALFDYDNDGWLDIYLVNALSHAARRGEE